MLCGLEYNQIKSSLELNLAKGNAMNCINPERRWFYYSLYDEWYLGIIGKKSEDIAEIIAAPFTTVKGIPNRREAGESVFSWRGYSEKTGFHYEIRKRWNPNACVCNVLNCGG